MSTTGAKHTHDTKRRCRASGGHSYRLS